MRDLMEKFKVTRLEGNEIQELEDTVIKEFPLEIYINDRQLVKLVCSPSNLKELAVGYLFFEGLIKEKDDINNLEIQDRKVLLGLKAGDLEAADRKNNIDNKLNQKLITSGCGKSTIYTDLSGAGLKKVRSKQKINSELIFEAVSQLYSKSEIFKKTGAVHNALLLTVNNESVVFREDIGRHNTIDKIVGYMVLQQVNPEDKILAISGRVSAEMLLKTARRQLPVIISRSAPTDLGIRLAYRLGITLIGFARGKRCNIYTHKERILGNKS